MVISTQQLEVSAFKAHPGDVARTVFTPAHAAMAMCAPLAGKRYSKPDCITKAAAFNHFYFTHENLLSALNSCKMRTGAPAGSTKKCEQRCWISQLVIYISFLR